MGRIDFAGINESILGMYPNILTEWLPGGKVEGHEYKATNPTRPDRKAGSFSINVESGVWSDFATGDSGSDPISLYAYLNNISQGASAKELAKKNGSAPLPPAPPKKKTEGEWTPILPVPDSAPHPHDNHFRLGAPTASWEYRDSENRLLGYTCRFDLPDGGKEIWPQTFCQNKEGKTQWRWLSFPKPRPLYGLPFLAEHPDAQVFVVEGEKCVDTVQALSDKIVAISWPGGGKAIQNADWSPLAGKKCTVWPDADQPGCDAALRIHKQLAKIADVRYVQFPQEVKQGWDLHDAVRDMGWGINEVVAYAKAHLLTDPKALTTEAPEAQLDPKEREKSDKEKTSIFKTAPFQLLGHNRGMYYYHPKETKQVLEVPIERHTSKIMTALAPVRWWESYFIAKKGVDWGEAIDVLFRAQHKLGIYDVSRVRGCGAWIDNHRVVVHCGDHLDVDGEKKQVYEIDSDYIYEASIKKRINDDPPIATQDSAKLLDICERMCWEKPINGKLLAGWIVLAPICGALNWRPHIQITGAAGSGKTWTIENIIQPVLGDIVLQVTSNTTEAGIRQKLKSNAFPILFDEAEGESQRARFRIQDILDLMRQASSESGASITKGTRSGIGIDFKIRSCFCIASIGVPMVQHADVSRVSVLTLRVNTASTRIQDFEELKRKVRETINPLWSSGLRSRSIRMIKTIVKNIEVFGKATAEILGTQRMGDQVGSLLAGAYTLKSEDVCSYEMALKWVGSQDWEEYQVQNLDTDEYRCISRILQMPMLVKADGRSMEITVSEMVEQVLDHDPHKLAMGEWDPSVPKPIISFEEAETALKRTGIKVTKDTNFVLVSDNNALLQKYMADSPWGTNWGRILRRIPNAEKRSSERFSLGVRQRATAIPSDWLRAAGKQEDDPEEEHDG